VGILAEMAAIPKPDPVVKESFTAEPAAAPTERIVGNIVVERAPIPRPAHCLPAYVPMSQRRGAGGTGESVFTQ
jgi:hypothetical protein